MNFIRKYQLTIILGMMLLLSLIVMIHEGDKYIRSAGGRQAPSSIDGLTQMQELDNQWTPLNPNQFTLGPIISNNVGTAALYISGFSPSLRFSVGDRMRIIQSDSASYKYVNIINVKSNYIYLWGEQLTTASILSLSYSKYVSPAGFPPTFQRIVPSFTYEGTLTENITNARSEYISVIGNLVFVQGITDQFVNGSGRGVAIRLAVQNFIEPDRGIDHYAEISPPNLTIFRTPGKLNANTSGVVLDLLGNDYYSYLYLRDFATLDTYFEMDYSYYYRLKIN